MCRSAGMDDYIEKPFRFSELFQMIDRYGTAA
jgi:CheY-like chemotaxis protein